jgi:uncharacterized tellurite resistance protein B-like protein
MSALSNEEKKSHFKNLTYLALIDGQIDDSEKHLLAYLGAKLGLTETEIQEVLRNPATVRPAFPASPDQRLEQVNELVAMLVIDKTIQTDELRFCLNLAGRLGIHRDQVKATLADLIRRRQPHKAKSAIASELDTMFREAG